ncbi:MAG: hypothetical protein FWF97_02690 [Alphaproteobacteria bacterium]|nr:hypothetical protein [Alphaproteobacteria bacterium]
MNLKLYSRKDMQAIMDDELQNKRALNFIKKYLFECTKRNRRLKDLEKRYKGVYIVREEI